MSEAGVKNIIGLISGTSVDGVDAALVQISGFGFDTSVKLLSFVNHPFPPEIREEIFALFSPKTGTVDRICVMNFVVGEVFADAAFAVTKEAGIDMSAVDLIGSHGQTIYHTPTPTKIGGKSVRSTLQIGEPAVIAERTGVTTIADFRTRDMAAGGEGAPLVPLADYILFRSPDKCRVAQNIGGIGNLTLLRPGAAIADVMAFDTGPGNMIIDGVMSIVTDRAMSFDKDGKMAASGTVNGDLLAELMTHPYFAKKPPKSTGREEFGLEYAAELVAQARDMGLTDEDLVATVTAFTAESIVYHYQKYIIPKWGLDEVIVSGGGSYNPTLVRMLKSRLPGRKVSILEEVGLSSDAKEAVAFAILANETYNLRPGNVPSATGALHPVVLGKIVPGRNARDGRAAL